MVEDQSFTYIIVFSLTEVDLFLFKFISFKLPVSIILILITPRLLVNKFQVTGMCFYY